MGDEWFEGVLQCSVYELYSAGTCEDIYEVTYVEDQSLVLVWDNASSETLVATFFHVQSTPFGTPENALAAAWML